MGKDIRKDIGQKIRQLRESQNLTQSQLAGCVGIRQSHLSRIELGTMSVRIDILSAICDALYCKIEIVPK
jgi:transcriptional regulator with XRE-family HTH domain